eukprot:COSAG02_NODE_1182_length_14021_cov_4.502442_10_plen_33_part_00
MGAEMHCYGLDGSAEGSLSRSQMEGASERRAD